MAKHKQKTSLFIVLVDAYSAWCRYKGANRGSGRWCVCAKNAKCAEQALACHIGKNHGSIRCYYEIKEDDPEWQKYSHLALNECEKVC